MTCVQIGNASPVGFCSNQFEPRAQASAASFASLLGDGSDTSKLRALASCAVAQTLTLTVSAPIASSVSFETNSLMWRIGGVRCSRARNTGFTASSRAASATAGVSPGVESVAGAGAAGGGGGADGGGVAATGVADGFTTFACDGVAGAALMGSGIADEWWC